MQHLPAIALTVPMLAATLLAALGRVLPRRADEAVALLATVTSAVLSIALALSASRGAVVVWSGGWSIVRGVPLGVALVADSAGAWLSALAASLTTIVLLFSTRYFESVGKYFTPLMLLLCAAMIGFALSGDLFNMFVFLELMSVASFALTGYKIEERQSVQGALTFAVTNTVAGALILLGIGLLYARLGTLNLAELGVRAREVGPSPELDVAAALVLAGLLTKAGIVPFHFWIGDAYAVAPAPVGALFAGVVSDMGLYGIARVRHSIIGHEVPGIGGVLLVLGLSTALVGGLMSTGQRNVKRLVAFSVCCHLGVVLVGLALGGQDATEGAALYLLAHAALNAGLLLAAGAMLNALSSVDAPKLAARGCDRPWMRAVFLIAALGLAGLPPFGTFSAKAAIEEAARAHGYPWVPWLLSMAVGLTAGALLRTTLRIFTRLGERTERDDGHEEERRESSSPRALLLVSAFLIAGCIAIGVVPEVRRATAHAAIALVNAGDYRAAVLDHHAIAPHAHAVHAATAESYGFALLSLSIALAVGLVPFARAPVIRRSVRALAKLASPIHAAHTGGIGDYVAWMMAGTAAVGWFFLAVSG